MTINPAAAADGVRLAIRICIFAIRVRRPAGAGGSRIRRRFPHPPAPSSAGPRTRPPVRRQRPACRAVPASAP
jgi:hypothetical protein